MPCAIIAFRCREWRATQISLQKLQPHIPLYRKYLVSCFSRPAVCQYARSLLIEWRWQFQFPYEFLWHTLQGSDTNLSKRLSTRQQFYLSHTENFETQDHVKATLCPHTPTDWTKSVSLKSSPAFYNIPSQNSSVSYIVSDRSSATRSGKTGTLKAAEKDEKQFTRPTYQTWTWGPWRNPGGWGVLHSI